MQELLFHILLQRGMDAWRWLRITTVLLREVSFVSVFYFISAFNEAKILTYVQFGSYIVSLNFEGKNHSSIMRPN